MNKVDLWMKAPQKPAYLLPFLKTLKVNPTLSNQKSKRKNLGVASFFFSLTAPFPPMFEMLNENSCLYLLIRITQSGTSLSLSAP